MQYNKLIDHTLLKQDAQPEQIVKLCDEAKQFDFMSVCVNPAYVPLAAKCLETSDVKVCTVIGFPLGMNLTKTKVEEAVTCVKQGADEVDMVINVDCNMAPMGICVEVMDMRLRLNCRLLLHL